MQTEINVVTPKITSQNLDSKEGAGPDKNQGTT